MLIAAGPAEASLTEFSFSYAGTIGTGPVSGAGFLFGTEIGSSGTYLLTSGYGYSPEGGDLTLLPANYPSGVYADANGDYLQSDNLLTPSSNPILTDNGLVFAGTTPPLPAGYQYIGIWGGNLWGSGGGYYYFNSWSANGPVDFNASPYSVSFAVANLGAVPAAGGPTNSVPEPITLCIWSVLGAAGAAAFRRHKLPKGRWSEENRQAIFDIIERSR